MAGKRRYASTLRAAQTDAARARILDAAGRLFTERGYLGTTITGVAEAAQVSLQTVYNVLGGKSVLLKAVYDRTLAGDDQPVPLTARPLVQAVIDAADGRSCLAAYARMARVLGERTLSLVVVLLAQAATGDQDLREFTDTIESERATGTRNCARHVADRFGLRPGLDLDAAADILWTLTAPEVVDRLVHRRGWGWDRVERWLGDTIADALLGPQAER